ncbi:MAG: MFS transporter [candidate division Zixibacteria bacterium]|nr:MFS transporter [candidate division Zixibacteria bacterium]
MDGKRVIWRRDVIAWALYDFANTIYSMNILSLYFAGWLVIDLGYADIHYSLAFAGSMLLAAILMPALGYLSDNPSGGKRKLHYLLIFTLGAVLSVAGFALLPPSMIGLILVLFALSNFFYEGGIVFYNALLASVAQPENVGKVSGFGVALGYTGSVVGMVLVLPFVTGNLFGLEIPFFTAGGKAAAFLPTAGYFALFSIPIFFYVRERTVAAPVRANGSTPSHAAGMKAAYADIWRSIKATEKYPGLLRFLVADWFFEDAIATVIIFMAVYTERVMAMGTDDRTVFFIISTVCAMLGSYPLGRLADRYPPKRVLFGIVLGWIIILILFAFNSLPVLFWMLGPIVGVLLGGVWAVGRPLLMQLSPPEKLGEFFGLFSLSGRAAAVGGPLLWGAVVYLFSPERTAGKIAVDLLGLDAVSAIKLPYRLAILSLAAMMAVGLFIFRKVPEKKLS